MKCSKEGCSAAADLVPVLSFGMYDKPGGSRASVDLPMAVCSAHAIPDVASYVTVQGWGSLCYDMARRGLALPDYATTAIEFKPVLDMSGAARRTARRAT